jgi:hypothetical protein
MEREKCQSISAGRQLTGQYNIDSFFHRAAFFPSTVIVPHINMKN